MSNIHFQFFLSLGEITSNTKAVIDDDIKAQAEINSKKHILKKDIVLNTTLQSLNIYKNP